MPIFLNSKKTVHFAHIPKSGGTSIENYILSSGVAKYAFLDRNFAIHRADSAWNASSPQHIDGPSLKRLFPIGFFTDYFTMFRDPVERFASAYLFQMNEPGSSIKSININEFVTKHLEKSFAINGYCDNHFLPQSRFLYPGGSYKLFFLSIDGMEKVKTYLDNLFEIPNTFSQVPRTMQSNKQSSINLKASLTNKSVEQLKLIYKEDYELLKSVLPSQYN